MRGSILSPVARRTGPRIAVEPSTRAPPKSSCVPSMVVSGLKVAPSSQATRRVRLSTALQETARPAPSSRPRIAGQLGVKCRLRTRAVQQAKPKGIIRFRAHCAQFRMGLALDCRPLHEVGGLAACQPLRPPLFPHRRSASDVPTAPRGAAAGCGRFGPSPQFEDLALSGQPCGRTRQRLHWPALTRTASQDSQHSSVGLPHGKWGSHRHVTHGCWIHPEGLERGLYRRRRCSAQRAPPRPRDTVPSIPAHR
jgi:hypothetical protein